MVRGYTEGRIVEQCSRKPVKSGEPFSVGKVIRFVRICSQVSSISLQVEREVFAGSKNRFAEAENSGDSLSSSRRVRDFDPGSSRFLVLRLLSNLTS